MKTRNWKIYKAERSRTRSRRMMASISRKGILMLNREAFRALGSPKALTVMFDEADGGAIGLAAAAPDKPHSITFHSELPRGSRYLTLTHFCSIHSIKHSRTIVFTDPEFDRDGTLVLELRNGRAVSRRASDRIAQIAG